MALYDPVDGVYRKVAKKYDPVDGIYRNVKAAYDPVDGVYRQYFSSGTPVGSLVVGDSVWLNVDGVLTEFLVVHQGNPDSAIYDASCDGTWLLMKDIHSTSSMGGYYQSSTIHTYLNETFLTLLESDIRDAVKDVKIPYHSGGVGSLYTGSNGLNTKVFLLACSEVGGGTTGTRPADGTCLDYFNGAGSGTLIAYLDGVAKWWWLRSPYVTSNQTYMGRRWAVDTSGYTTYSTQATVNGVRPAFILDSATLI